MSDSGRSDLQEAIYQMENNSPGGVHLSKAEVDALMAERSQLRSFLQGIADGSTPARGLARMALQPVKERPAS